MSEIKKVTAKIKQNLERACFLAFSDIEATEKQLHGNSCKVVNKTEADAIFTNALGDLKKTHAIIEKKKLQELIENRPRFVYLKYPDASLSEEVYEQSVEEWVEKKLKPLLGVKAEKGR